ncbi:MAG: hypothetical protein ABFS02_04450 [Pseudomonadota bacterium]
MHRTIQLLRLFFSFCFFRNQPEDIPESDAVALFKRNVYLYLVMWLIVLSTLEDLVAAVLQTGIGLVMTLSYIWLLLFASRRLQLFLRSATAVMGVQTIFVAASFPWVLSLHVSEAEKILYPFYIIILLGLWLLAVIAYLLKKSLSTTKMSSSLMAVGYFSAVLGSAFALFA